MKKLIVLLLLLTTAVAFGVGGIKKFSQDNLQFGTGATKSIRFDEVPDGNTGILTFSDGGDVFSMNKGLDVTGDSSIIGSFDVNGEFVVASTAFGSKPCPLMTTAQRNALTPTDGTCVYDIDVHSLHTYDSLIADWKEVGANPLTTQGDLLYFTTEATRLPIGSDDQVLTVVGGQVAWAAPSVSTTLTTKGDLQTYDTANQRLPVGADKTILTANSAEATGLQYVDVMKYNNNGLKSFINNPDAEQGSIEGSATNALITVASSGSLDTAKSNNFFRLIASAAGEYTNTITHNSDWEGKGGLFSIELRRSTANVTVQLLVDAVVQNEVSVIGTTWKNIEIPFVYGSTSVAYKIVYDAADAAIDYDSIYLGKVPVGYIQDVGQAHFVGSLNYEVANCIWQTTSATYADFPVDADCVASNVTGDILAPDTKIPGLKIPNARTDGYYEVKSLGLFFSGGSDTACVYSISDSSSYVNQGVAFSNSSSGAYDRGYVTGNIRFNSGGDKSVRIIGRRVSGTDTCQAFGSNIGGSRKFTVHFYPDSNATVVSQETELKYLIYNKASTESLVNGTSYPQLLAADALENNGFTINESTDDITVSKSEKYEVFAQTSWATNATGVRGIDLLVNNLEITEGCRVQIAAAAGSGHHATIHCPLVNLKAGDKVKFGIRQQSGANLDLIGYSIKLKESPVSATIIGKFENINSSDLCQVIAHSNDLDLIAVDTEDIPFKTIVNDNCAAWSNAGNTGANTSDAYTAQKDTLAIFSISVGSGTALGVQFKIYEDGVYIQACGTTEGTTTKGFTCIVKTVKDSVYTLRTSTALTLGSSSAAHRLTITELPDTESIVKNLLAESSQTKCQTKVLSANITSDTASISDISLSGLTIGKKYQLYGQTRASVNGDSLMAMNFQDGGGTFRLRLYVGNGAASTTQVAASADVIFTADSTTITASTTSMAGTSPIFYGTNNETGTIVRLCQLPDTYVETTEW